MSLTGGKRKVNKSLKAWVRFVKKVQKQEKLSYKNAIHRAKVRKDKGERWMIGGAPDPEYIEEDVIEETVETMPTDNAEDDINNTNDGSKGGRGRGRTVRRASRRSVGRNARRTARRGRSRSSRRH